MRSFREFVTDIVKKPPMVFPIVGLFHILWFLWTLGTNYTEPFPGPLWLEILWMTGYTTFWIAACDLRKWGEKGYIFLALVNTALYICYRNNLVPEDYKNNMVFLDVLFSFILLYYSKIFR